MLRIIGVTCRREPAGGMLTAIPGIVRGFAVQGDFPLQMCIRPDLLDPFIIFHDRRFPILRTA